MIRVVLWTFYYKDVTSALQYLVEPNYTDIVLGLSFFCSKLFNALDINTDY